MFAVVRHPVAEEALPRTMRNAASVSSRDGYYPSHMRVTRIATLGPELRLYARDRFLSSSAYPTMAMSANENHWRA